MTNKTLSLMHLVSASSLVGKSDQLDTQLQLVALYQAPTATVIQAAKDPSQLDPFIQQAAEMPPTDAAEVVADFLEQFGAYHRRLQACLEAQKAKLQAPRATAEPAIPEAPEPLDRVMGDFGRSSS